MTIQYCSDLHLEFIKNRAFLEVNPIIPKGNILLLAGDIIPFDRMDECEYFFDFVAENFNATYWVAGNHEYYHSDVDNIYEKYANLKFIRDNVMLVNNTSVIHNDVKFIFTTLWSKIEEESKVLIQQRINDFRLIKFKSKTLSVEDFNKLHEESLSFLTNQIKDKSYSKRIVVTHHVPTLLNYPETYKGSSLNEAFAVELFDLIESSDVDYWIFGHHHFNVDEFKIGKTKMLTNQLGYVHAGEHVKFQFDKTFNI